MVFQIERMFTAVGCSCRPNILEWCPTTKFIIFGASCNICVIDFDSDNDRFRIVETAAAHDSEVTSLTVAKSTASLRDYSLICSGSVLNQLKLWSLSRNSSPRLICLKTVDALSISPNFLAAYSADGLAGLCAFSQYDKVAFLDFSTVESTETDPPKSIPSISFSTPVLSLEFIECASFVLLAIGLSNGNLEVFYTERHLNNPFSNAISIKQTQNSWVRAIATKALTDDHFYLAFACDELIKVWKFGKGLTIEDKDGDIKAKPIKFELRSDKESAKVLAKLDAVLAAHDGKVHSLCWNPCPGSLQLLSSSSDKNVILWEFSAAENHWLPKFRLGEVGGEEVGFYDAIFSPNGDSILYHSFYGAFSFWTLSEENAFPVTFPVSGHFGDVTDLSWDPSGSYLVSCGSDKVTRIFAPYKGSFVEIARPQIHGHDLNCLVPITSTIFVSGGEEKIFRVFQASSSFIRNLQNISAISSDQLNGVETISAASATLPELGLSNKAVPFDQIPSGSETIPADGDFIFKEPPRDEQLSRFTLFPEVHKLYGHGFEVFAVAANHRGTVLATSCKASQPDHAEILLWDTTEWQQRATLKAHQLTVTQLSFSPDDRFLLSVSRDRTWTLFRATSPTEDPFAFSTYFNGDKRHGRHSRIIWACAWAHDSRLFATVSRDKILNIWRIDDAIGTVTHLQSYCAADSLTAVDFAPGFVGDGLYLLSVGQDDGKILLLQVAPEAEPATLVLVGELSRDLAHSKTVTRLRFRPRKNPDDPLELASASTDHTIKVHQLRIDSSFPK